MNEKDFELMHVLSETRNLTRAADQMFMTQSALTKKVQAIERELGVDLLVRSRQGVTLTPAGETVVHYCRRASEILEEMRKALDAQRDTVCGTLRLGASVNYAIYRLPDILERYHKEYPKVQLRLTTGHSRHLYRKLQENCLDAAILRGDYEWDGPRWLLAQESMCVICAKAYDYTPLSEYPYISRETDSAMAAQIARWIRENKLNPQPNGLHVDSLDACVEMAARGLGWALVPEICLDHFHGSVRRCTFESNEPFVRQTWLLANKDAMSLPQVKAFVQAVNEFHGTPERRSFL